MLMDTVLTVAESKRLIAKGVAAHSLVKQALEKGTVIVARGSTNGYVAEELLGEPMDKLAFLTGHTLPRGYAGPAQRPSSRGEIVIRRGEVVAGLPLAQTVADLQAGDVFIKGANALSPDRRRAGILVGSPTGGTIGAFLPTITERKAHFIAPVGLEKLVASDLPAVSQLIVGDGGGRDAVPDLWVIDTATIITEIEALELLTGAVCHHLASGGIGGAEGSVRLLVSGDERAMGKARRVLDSIAGEPPFPI